jgi:hypothetical protein
VLLLVLVGAAALWGLQRQEAQRRQAVETALAEAEALQRQARWGEAEAILTQADRRLGETAAEDLEARQARADLKMARRLDEIREGRDALVDGLAGLVEVAPQYAGAFFEHGLDLPAGDPEALAARLTGSAIAGPSAGGCSLWRGGPTRTRGATASATSRCAAT